MSNDYFQFKQFTIWHDQCAMRVNTDGVMLGAWASVWNPAMILDIGSGTGILSLMLAQRSTAVIHGIELEENAWKQAVSNAGKSPWNDRIVMIHDDFCRYSETSDQRYSLIVSNPPYFSNSLKSPSGNKTLARHTDSLPFGCLLRGVSRLLTPGGIFAVILPSGTLGFEDEAYISGLSCTRRMDVRSLPGKKVIRRLLEFRRERSAQPVLQEELTIFREPGIYSSAYIDLTKDFYLYL